VPASPIPSPSHLIDQELARRAGNRDPEAFEAVMREHNGRLFRVARAILKDDTEAEDALQDAYLDAFAHIADFDGRAALGTWLTRIVINRALMRLRKTRRDRVVVPFGPPPEGHGTPTRASDDRAGADAVADPSAEPPLTTALRAEMRRLLERRIDALPLAFRTVFVMCEVDEMSTAEVAASLSIPQATVRTRLFRARSLLRASLAQDLDRATTDVFAFAGPRCDRIVAAVLSRMDETGVTSPTDPHGGNAAPDRGIE